MDKEELGNIPDEEWENRFLKFYDDIPVTRYERARIDMEDLRPFLKSEGSSMAAILMNMAVERTYLMIQVDELTKRVEYLEHSNRVHHGE